MCRKSFVLFAAVYLALSIAVLPAQRPPEPNSATAQSDPPQSLGRQYFDRHFEGMHPTPRLEFGGARPGSKLFKMRSQRTQALAARIRAVGAPAQQNGTAPPILPGLTTRQPMLGAGSVPISMATGDFNHDGHLDFAVANGGTNDIWIYFGSGDNTFQLPRITSLRRGVGPLSLVAADLRKNGTLDLVVAEIETGTVGVLLGNGDGTFANETLYTVPHLAAVVTVNDFNHDGKPDIAVALANSRQDNPMPAIAMLPGNGDGTFGQALLSYSNNLFFSTSTEITVDSGDINNDGYPDLIVLQPLYQMPTGLVFDAVVVYMNNGDGTFKESAPIIHADAIAYPTDARLADVNGDGCLDALVADLVEVVFVGLGDCTGSFGQLMIVPMGGPATTVRIADLNGDGFPDLVTGSAIVRQLDATDPIGTTVGVALGDGKGNFGPARVYMGASEESALAVGDFAGNGSPSIVTADVDTDTVTVFVNDGNADFGAPEGIYSGKTIYGNVQPAGRFTIADLNGDGKPDLFQLGGFDAIYSMTFLNDGKGRFAWPILSSFGAAASQQYMGDYRLGDFRNTGHLDMVGIGVNAAYDAASQVILFQPGEGDGSFGTATITPTSGADGAMTTGDFNRDGKLDFVTVNGAQTHILTPFFGNGDGTFRAGTPVTFTDQNVEISRVYTGDFNRDGKPDVLVFTTSNGYWVPFLAIWEVDGQGNGTFQPGRELYNGFQPFTLADMNNDGHPDIVRYDTFWPDGNTETFAPPKITTYLGQADGTFAQSSSYVPYPDTTPVNLAPYTEFGDMTTSALAADYSGDGNVDVAAFQQGNGYVRSEQFLAGNGDGTLVPTYDVFGFPSFTYPLQAYDLNGDRRADQVMFDGGGGNTITVPGAPPPALQLYLENYVINGSSNCGVVFANVPVSSARTVTLRTSVPDVLLPGATALPSGALSVQFCYTLAATYDETRVHDIRATLDGDTATAYASQAYVPPFGVSLSSEKADPVYEGGQTAPVTVNVNPQGKYTGVLKLSCSGLPAGFNCAFSPSQLTVSPGVSSTAQVVVQTAPGLNGDVPITIIADDGVSIERHTLTLEIANLSITTMTVNALVQDTSPGTATTDVIVNGIPPFTLSCNGLPAGTACQFSGTQQTYPVPSDITITIALPAGISPANSTFTVTAQSGGFTVQTSETLGVFEFTMHAPSASQDWASSPSSPSVSFPVLFTNLADAPATVTCTLDGATVCQTASISVRNSTTSIQEFLNLPSGVAVGKHNLTVSETVAGIPRTFNFPFWIAEFSGTISANSVTIASGGSASVAGTLTATSGFSSSIVVFCAAPSQIMCTFQPSPVNLTGGTPATFTARLQVSSVAANHSPAKYSFVVPELALALLLPAGFALFGVHKRWRRIWLAVVLGTVLSFCVSSCGSSSGASGSGSGGGNSPPPPSNYSVSFVARDSTFLVEHTIGSVTVTVNH